MSSAPDPFVFNENWAAGLPGYNNTTGKTLLSSVISDPANTKTIITLGQSNHATHCGSGPYTTVSSQAQNLSIYDGGIYSGSDPVLGCSFSGASSVNMRIADSMISRGKATRCIVVPIAAGSSNFARWADPSDLFGRLTAAILRCRARGLEPDAFFCGMGEQDNNFGTSAASITASIWAMVDALRSSPISCETPFYVGLFSLIGGATSATVRTGITNAVDAARNIVLGYDADTNLTVAGGFRLGDQTHLSDTGLTALATGWTVLAFP